MATFRIHQDAEKENPPVMPLKEKTLAGIGGVGALKPQTGAVLGKVALGRSNFAVLNNVRGNGAVAHAAAAASKVAFREVSNVGKVNDENAGIAKKSTVVPVVEQFKTFSVYEDKSEPAVRLPLQPRTAVAVEQTSASATTIASTTAAAPTAISANAASEVDKENSYQRAAFAVKSDKVIKEFVPHTDDDYILDTTPMSVSDVLSPMSIDRSQLLLSTSQHMRVMVEVEKENKGIDGEVIGDGVDLHLSRPKEEMLRMPLARNDRQRFFEVVEYQRCILEYFRESEQKHRPKPHYMRRQSDINHSMRTILVDWLVEVSEEYNLDTETLYLSISYIDRFLSHMSVVRSKLQLVGTAAMFIASKYEEIYPPDVSEFVFITDDTYNKAQVLRMEQIILKILTFDLCTPTAYVFINTYAVLVDMSDKQKYLTQYICELSLLEADPFLRFLPSLISAAALALARHLLGQSIWSMELEDVTSYRLEDLKEVFVCLCKSHNAAGALAQQAIQEKYKADKYKRVSTISAMECDEATFDEIARQYNEDLANLDENEDPHNVSQTTATSNENVRRMISLMFN